MRANLPYLLSLLAAIMALGVLAGCTIVYIEGSGNNVSDSGNHSGTLSVPESDGMRSVRLTHSDTR
jgi:hypothetical protein